MIRPLLFLVVLLAACKSQAPQTLRLSMIPTTDPSKAIREMQPLLDYLSQRTGTKVEMTVPTNYAAVVEALVNDQVDVADLEGHTFAFGDVNSTSGHLMPEYFMREAKVNPAVISKAIYTGGHDATLLAVANVKVDAGALDEAVFQRLTSSGKVDPQVVRVFYTTPPFFDYVWVARKGLDPALAKSVADSFLALDAGDPAQKQILDALAASKYVTVEDQSYDKLRTAARAAGLLK